MPPYDPVKYTADSWEHVLYTDALQRLVYLTSYASFHSNQQQSNQPLLFLAYRLTCELTSLPTLSTVQRLNLLSTQDYRAFGVIYGQYARHLKEVRGDSSREEQREASLQMRRMWRMYLDVSPDDQEIRRIYDSSLNPYTGDVVGEG